MATAFSADEASTIELYSPQLGLLDAATLPIAGAETAAKVRNPHLPPNELIRNRSPRP